MRNYWQVIHLLTWKHVHLILSRVLKHNIVNKPNILVINQNNMKKNKPCWIKNIILGYFAIQKMFINKALKYVLSTKQFVMVTFEMPQFFIPSNFL